MDKLDYISTEDIDISSKRDDFTVRVRLRRPDVPVRFPGGDVVEFAGVVEEAYVAKTVTALDIIALDLDGRFELSGIRADQGPLNSGETRLDLRSFTPGFSGLPVDLCPGLFRERDRVFALRVISRVVPGRGCAGPGLHAPQEYELYRGHKGCFAQKVCAKSCV